MKPVNKGLNVLAILLVFLLASCERPTDFSEDDDGIPPAVPEGLRFYMATDGEIIIEWNRNPEKDLRGYNVYRKVNDEDFKLVFFTSSDYYLDDSLNYDDEYSYKISAIDLSGRESSTTDSISAIPVNRYIPRPPPYPQINARNWQGQKSIMLKWQPLVETDIKGFNIYRSENSGFTADSSSLIGFSTTTSFNDTSFLEFYKRYFYRIRAVDKGELVGRESSEISDAILEIPEVVYPLNNIITEFFYEFEIKAIGAPATYRVVVQNNELFDEFWTGETFSEAVNDVIQIRFTPPYLEYQKKYYWRIITYTPGNAEPNSISPLFNFTIKERF